MLSRSSSTRAALTGRIRPSGTSILLASMLSTFLMNVPLGMPAVYGLLRSPLHPSQPPFWRQHTPAEGFEASGGGSSKLQMDSPGHCCDRTPAVDESRAKKNPHRCVCMGGLPPFESFEAPKLKLPIASACQQVFWMQRRKIHRAHDRPLSRFRLTLLSVFVPIVSFPGRPDFTSRFPLASHLFGNSTCKGIPKNSDNSRSTFL